MHAIREGKKNHPIIITKPIFSFYLIIVVIIHLTDRRVYFLLVVSATSFFMIIYFEYFLQIWYYYFSLFGYVVKYSGVTLQWQIVFHFIHYEVGYESALVKRRGDKFVDNKKKTLIFFDSSELSIQPKKGKY